MGEKTERIKAHRCPSAWESRPALLCVLDRVESGQQMTAGVVLAVCALVSLAMWGLIIVGILTVLGVL